MLFLGLILRADDYGIVQAHPGVIASQVFMFAQRSRAEVSAMLDDLVAAGQLIPFVVNRVPYFALRKWFRHQHLHRPEPLKVRPPDDVIDALAEAAEDDRVRALFTHEGQQSIIEGRRARATYAASRRRTQREERPDDADFGSAA